MVRLSLDFFVVLEGIKIILFIYGRGSNFLVCFLIFFMIILIYILNFYFIVVFLKGLVIFWW